MKPKISLFFILTILILCCGCGKNPIQPNPTLPDQEYIELHPDNPSDPQAPANYPIIAENDSNPPEEGMVRSPLTNEWINAKVAAARPIAVMIPNESAAIPHYALSDASILYEANVEGRMTRLMAIFEDWNGLEKIGNIRSARTYFIYWSYEWDAFFVHFGGPYYINELLDQETTENINGISKDSDAFYRDKNRTEPHNVYTSGSRLKKQILANKYRLSYRGLTSEAHFQFASKLEPNSLAQYGADAQNASYIDMSGCYPLTRCYFEYNESDGLYYRFQHLSGSSDEAHTDASGTQLSFKNILVQYTKQEVLDAKGYLVFQCHDDTRDGWFFTNGRGIHVNWVKNGDYEATKYYDDDGNEIVLNTGKTMICIVNETDSFTFR